MPSMRFMRVFLIEISFYKVFTVWLLVASNDLCIPQQMPQIMLSIKAFTWQVWNSYRIEISCLRGFHSLTSGDLKWRLTLTKTHRNFFYSEWGTTIPRMKFVNVCLLKYHVYKIFAFDFQWLRMILTSTNNNIHHSLSMWHPHTKHEISHVYSSWDIVFPKKSVTENTHAHSHDTLTHTWRHHRTNPFHLQQVI